MAQKTDIRVAADILIRGVVQGVGFRPFVQRLAKQFRLTGHVKNESGHVVIAAWGRESDVRAFLREITGNPPTGAHIESVEEDFTAEAENSPEADFVIVQSGNAGNGKADYQKAMMTPDIAVCEDCLRELLTPGDPRFHNPFISCVSCGPRFSIAEALPYDRENTTMRDFDMCALCARQYKDGTDRRCHAQTVCCNGCGPALCYEGRGNAVSGNGVSAFGNDASMAQAVTALKDGGIVAIKGIGGYHFACSPYAEETVRRLRDLKGREDKPFAVMFPALCDVMKLCRVDARETALLLSPARPIVLLTRLMNDFAESVARTSRYLGAFLPYTPLQYLLLRETGPLVMTSANVSSLPIIKDDDVMRRFFMEHPQLDGVLSHNRSILRRLDDSVTAVVNEHVQLIRRARGYVPLTLRLDALRDCPPLLACGAQQKNVVCLTSGPLAYLSTETGDLDGGEAIDLYKETIGGMEALFRLEPSYAVCDMHPDYASTRYARETGLPAVEVQHHFAHIASVMAEHDIRERVIGVAFDGTGYGTDGTVWGGEFLVAEPGGFTRGGHLKAVRLLGGDASVYQGWKTAACMMVDAGIAAGGDDREKLVRAALDNGVNTIRSSSMGRVFDAVSALLGICGESTYEGQGAVELENAAAAYAPAPGEEIQPLPFGLAKDGGEYIIDLAPCFRELDALKKAGVGAGLLSLRFHRTVAKLIGDMCQKIRDDTGIARACLSGGVFQNRILMEEAVPALVKSGFEVLFNEQVPPNDGGIALGQAFAACHILKNSGR